MSDDEAVDTFLQIIAQIVARLADEEETPAASPATPATSTRSGVLAAGGSIKA